MPDCLPVPPSTSGSQALAEARIRFLNSESVRLGEVREAILASWWRSHRSAVPADRIEVPYSQPTDLDTSWVHGLQPLLGKLGEQLDGQSISLIITDPTGAVVSQQTGDPDLHRYLERVHLLPGFSYGEGFVGTNGIGTALEDGRQTCVFGHEHYAEHLETLACAGVPIRHPISGKTIGAVDLTCWAKDASGLLITLARSAAEQVRQALLTHASVRELELFRAYLQTCRRTGGIVLALNGDVVMMNDHARQLLDPVDQRMVIRNAELVLGVSERSSTTVDLPSGNKVRMHCRRVGGSSGSGEPAAGDVLHVELIDGDTGHPSGGHATMLPAFVPGTVGSAPLWLRCCNEVDAGYRAGEWLALRGEPGVGKYTLAGCVHQRHNPQRRLRSCDAAASGEDDWLASLRSELLDDPAGTLVIRHADQLDAGTADGLAAVLDEVRRKVGPDRLWVVVTLGPGHDAQTGLNRLMSQIPRTVEVPPLHYHVEDIRELVPFLLNKLAHGSRLSCSAEAMKLLMRDTWPGNVEQLYQVLKQVTVDRRRTGTIQPQDLPQQYHAVTKRALNQIESIERDAIVDSLRDAGGNKAHAAKSLGMSRATIYRKIRDYGIVAPSRTG